MSKFDAPEKVRELSNEERKDRLMSVVHAWKDFKNHDDFRADFSKAFPECENEEMNRLSDSELIKISDWALAHNGAANSLLRAISNDIADGIVSSAQKVILAQNVRNREKAPKVQKPPGSFLLAVAEACYSKKNYEEVFCQAIADYRQEYFEAAATGKKIKKFFIVIRHWWALGTAVIKLTPIIGVAYLAIEKYTSE